MGRREAAAGFWEDGIVSLTSFAIFASLYGMPCP
jgi:hypothetical protein